MRRCLIAFASLCVALASVACAALPIGPSAGSAQAPITTIKIASAAITGGGTSPIFVGRAKGYFNDERINLEVIQMTGTASTAALASGDLDLSGSSGTAMNSILHGGQLKVISASIEAAPYSIYTNMPGVNSLRDLEGKPVGIQQTADSYHEAAVLALVTAGVDPEKVAFVSLGTGQQRMAAVVNNSVAATPLLSSELETLRKLAPEARLLADAGKLGVKQHVAGIAASVDRIARDRESLIRFFVAYLKSVRFASENLEAAAALMAADAQIVETKVPASALLPAMRDYWEKPLPGLQHTKEAQQAIVDAKTKYFVKDATPGIGPAQIFDFSVVDEAAKRLAASGWKP